MDVKERPITYRAEMIESKLDGSKTMTRRVLEVQPEDSAAFLHFDEGGRIVFDDGTVASHRYGKVGDWLWSKESYSVNMVNGREMIAYKATPRLGLRVPGILFAVDKMTYLDEETDLRYHHLGWPLTWKSGRFMPKRYSRFRDEIVELVVERIQDITDEDILREGVTVENAARWLNVELDTIASLRDAFRLLWSSINGKSSWESNPWVLGIRYTPVAFNVWAATAPSAMPMVVEGEFDDETAALVDVIPLPR